MTQAVATLNKENPDNDFSVFLFEIVTDVFIYSAHDN